MPKRIGGNISAVMVMLCVALFAAGARGDSSDLGITVSGTAKVMGKPNAVEIGAFVSGDAELTADAVVKYRDARKRAVAALEGLKIANLSIQSDGFSVKDWVDAAAQQQAMMRGQQVANAKQKVSVGEQLRLVIKDADKMDQAALMDTMLKVLDTAKDAGLTIGNTSPGNNNNNNENGNQGGADALIQFKVTDCSALREQAYKQAMDDAKAKAQKLADLAGVKIGKILSVEDGDSDSNNSSQSTNASTKELSSGVFSDIPLTVAVTVQFEIEK